MTFEKGTGTTGKGASITMSSVGTTTRAFYSNGIRYGTIVIGGSSGTTPTTFYGTLNTFDDMTDVKAGTAFTVTFEAGKISQFKRFSLAGGNAVVLTLGSTSTTQHTIKKWGAFYVGTHSTNTTNSTGLTFAFPPSPTDYTDLPIDYINFSNIAAVSSTIAPGNMSNFF